MHPEFVPIAFISALSVLIVVPWHWRAGNIATLAMAFWLFISNVIYGVDAAIWGNNVDIVVPVWCDITSKLIIGTNFGLPAACLCICIHLERVASVRLASTSALDKRRRQLFETLMCFGLPILFMCLHFIVQGHRFDIIEEYGCRPTTYYSIPALFIVWIPPLVVSVAAIIFSGLALRHFMVRRMSFAAHLNASNSALTTSRYLRLMLMAVVQMVWSITITGYALWFTNMSVPIRPWTTWADVHSDFGRIDQYITLLTPQPIVTGFYVLWWMVPISTWIFVAFFAFGRDAVEEYKKCFLWFRVRVLRQTINPEAKKSSFISMPKSKSQSSLPRKLMMTSTTDTTFTVNSLPPYKAPTPPSPNTLKSLHAFDDDAQSDITHHDAIPSFAYAHEAKAIGSLSDLSSPTTASTLVSSTPRVSPWFRNHEVTTSPLTPISPPSAFPAPPRHPRLLDPQSPTSPRPFTYPSLDSSHRGINSNSSPV